MKSDKITEPDLKVINILAASYLKHRIKWFFRHDLITTASVTQAESIVSR